MRVSEIDIPEPCAEDWGQMTPRERGRFCASCQKTVHDLSAMTRDEARELLAQDGEMCVSYLSRGKEVMFAAPKVVPVSRLRRRLPQVAAAGLTLALAACAPHGEGPSLDEQQHETPVLLEFSPAIPGETKAPDAPEVAEVEVEPCPSTELRTPKPLIRTAGARMPVPQHAASPLLGRVHRTKGDRVAPTDDSTDDALNDLLEDL